MERVRAGIAVAAARCGRCPSEVRLIAVTKYVDLATTKVVLECGCTELGESRPQQLWGKAEAISEQSLSWHLVGHLQRNKVKRTVAVADWIHSVDSLRLLHAIGRQASEIERTVNVLLEVNVSGDSDKHGFAVGVLPELMSELAEYPHARVRGLMGMGSLHGGRERARRDFAALRNLRDRLLSRCPDGVSLEELSMGMSGDYDVAVEEGATMVRIGSALFGA